MATLTEQDTQIIYLNMDTQDTVAYPSRLDHSKQIFSEKENVDFISEAISLSVNRFEMPDIAASEVLAEISQLNKPQYQYAMPHNASGLMSNMHRPELNSIATNFPAYRHEMSYPQVLSSETASCRPYVHPFTVNEHYDVPHYTWGPMSGMHRPELNSVTTNVPAYRHEMSYPQVLSSETASCRPYVHPFTVNERYDVPHYAWGPMSGIYRPGLNPMVTNLPAYQHEMSYPKNLSSETALCRPYVHPFTVNEPYAVLHYASEPMSGMHRATNVPAYQHEMSFPNGPYVHHFAVNEPQYPYAVQHHSWGPMSSMCGLSSIAVNVTTNQCEVPDRNFSPSETDLCGPKVCQLTMNKPQHPNDVLDHEATPPTNSVCQPEVTFISINEPAYQHGVSDPNFTSTETGLCRPKVCQLTMNKPQHQNDVPGRETSPPAHIVCRPEVTPIIIDESADQLETDTDLSSSETDLCRPKVHQLTINKPQHPSEKYPAELTASPINSVVCDNINMIVDTSDQGSKKLCCPFCNKLVSKLARHLEAKHKQEPDVQKILSLEKGSKERRVIQDGLRNIGIVNWNKTAELNKKKMITIRRPNIKLKRTAVDFKPCPFCFGSYARSGLRHHVAFNCKRKPLKINNEATKHERTTMELAKLVDGRLHHNANQKLKDLFGSFRENRIVHLIRFDWLIIVYGNKLCTKYTKRTETQKAMKSYRLRMAGRILDSLKSIEPDVTDFESIFHPKYYDSLIEAIKTLAKFNDETDEFKTPACASIAVTIVRHVGRLLIAEYIKRDESANQRRAENFLKLLDTDAGITIGKAVTETQARMRREKTINLPTTADVKTLSLYVESQRNSCYEQLACNYTYTNWRELCKLTLASLLIYNRRRSGDTQHITVFSFHNREFMNENTNKEFFATLSEEAKKIFLQFRRMIARGKKGRDVSVLLKPKYEDCIKLLLAHREEAGVAPNNEFLFGLPTSHPNKMPVMNACNAIRKYANACGAENPSSLTGTNLRKHFATLCASMELSDSKVSDVADFMGHAEKVHREYYRQNIIDREVIQIAQLLDVAEGNGYDDDSDTDEDEGDESETEIIPELLMKAAPHKRNIGKPRSTLTDTSEKHNGGKQKQQRKRRAASHPNDKASSKKKKVVTKTSETVAAGPVKASSKRNVGKQSLTPIASKSEKHTEAKKKHPKKRTCELAESEIKKRKPSRKVMVQK